MSKKSNIESCPRCNTNKHLYYVKSPHSLKHSILCFECNFKIDGNNKLDAIVNWNVACEEYKNKDNI